VVLWLLAVGCTSGATDDDSSPTCGEPGQVTIVAGMPGIAGRGEDGLPATETWLSLPQDVAIGHDVWWIADYNNHLIREIDPAEVSRVAAGSGFPSGGDGGPALAEPLDHPTMALVDPLDPGVLWFAATGNHRIGRLDRARAVVDFPYGTGLPGFQGDGGQAADAWFWRPSSLAFDDQHTMYVSDRMNQVVRAIDADGIVSTVAGTPGVPGYAGDGGPAHGATLNAPAWTETDPGNRIDVRDGRLVLADTGNDAIREVDLATGIIDTLASPEHGFLEPHDVAIGANGTVYVADTGNHCVRHVTPDGEVRVAVGACGEEGPAVKSVGAADARFSAPVGVAVDADGGVWISDRNNQVIRRWCP
jgi:streptogramin lyase